MEQQYDFFISHASEDKDTIARPLALELSRPGLHIWYDEFSLSVGDSLYASIEKGLSCSRQGIVVLSKAFFEKKWTKKELGGLFSKHVVTGSRIIPVWHGIDHRYLVEHSPMLADILAIESSVGLEKMALKIATTIRPEFSYRNVGRLLEAIEGSKEFTKNEEFRRVIQTLEEVINIDYEISDLGLRSCIEDGYVIFASALIHICRFADAVDFIEKIVPKISGSQNSPTTKLVLGLLKLKARRLESGNVFGRKDVVEVIGHIKYDFYDLYIDPIFYTTKFFKDHFHDDIYFELLQFIFDSLDFKGSNREREIKTIVLAEAVRISRSKGNFAYALSGVDLMRMSVTFDSENPEPLALCLLERQRSLRHLDRNEESIKCSIDFESDFLSAGCDPGSDLLAWSIAERGISYRCMSDYDAASRSNLEFLRRYSSEIEKSKYAAQVAMVMGEQALVARKKDEFQRALELCNSAIIFCSNFRELDLKYEGAWAAEEKARVLVELGDLSSAIEVNESIIRNNSAYRESRFSKLIARCRHHIGFIQILAAKKAMKSGYVFSDVRGELASAEENLLIANSMNASSESLGSLAYISYLTGNIDRSRELIQSAFAIGDHKWLAEEIQDTFRFEIESDAEFRSLLMQAGVTANADNKRIVDE